MRKLSAPEQLFVYIAHTFEAQCQLAGETHLAERVRRSASHRQTEEVDEVSNQEGETETPSDDPPYARLCP